jgi:hypothetical protein
MYHPLQFIVLSGKNKNNKPGFVWVMSAPGEKEGILSCIFTNLLLNASIRKAHVNTMTPLCQQ